MKEINQTTLIQTGLVLSFAYILIKKPFDKGKINPATLPQQTQNEIKELEKQGQKLSFPQSTYLNMVERLLEAMRGLGTNENKVYSVFHDLRNELDLLHLIQVFGVKNYREFFSETPKNLAGWLNAELDNSEMRKLNSILAAKKFTYRF